MSSSSGEIVESGAEAPRGGRDPGPGGTGLNIPPGLGQGDGGKWGPIAGRILHLTMVDIPATLFCLLKEKIATGIISIYF